MSEHDESDACPTCGPTTVEQHPRNPGVTRCSNCKEWLRRVDNDARCGACGQPGEFRIILGGHPMPVCLRHLNYWRTPPADFTCPTPCVESNHPGREHADWLLGFGVIPPTSPDRPSAKEQP